MKQYDKIYIDAENPSQWRPTHEDLFVEVCGPLICLTLEELREMAIALVKEWIQETGNGSVIEDEVAEDLYKYLKTKGINTIP